MAVATAVSPVTYSTDSISSRDGTVIHYRQLGQGPGLVILHGSMEMAYSHMSLAAALADAFTVILPDRRGHILKDVQGKAYSMQKEVEDVDALLSKTGAHYVFGVSSGGLIALQAALVLPAVDKVAVYEPALIVNRAISTDFLARYDREIAEGKIVPALVTAMKGAQMGPPIFNLIPRWLMERFTTKMVKQEDQTPQPGFMTMRMLAPTIHYDFALVNEMAESLERFEALQTEVLLLGGSKSPPFLRAALAALDKTLPHAERIEFPGLDHGASSDPSATNRGGKPEIIAQALRAFLMAS